MKRYRWAFLRVDPYYHAWDWPWIALLTLVAVVTGFVIVVIATL